ncbi:twin-arginine translocase subunit TatC [uncultured Muribaculum sp.]|uniref:twin-arginine translocase subunit TatC n=1 Tax=uncultured Muribaculum sp. TaxID=1918613 RepID=UPI0025A94974|nr:twin-arginine translocase subunit TatC [uncultured Muribaculum sp.]
MSFWDHLESLRWMFARSAIAVAVCFIGVFAFVPWLFDHVVMAPVNADFPLYRFLNSLGTAGAFLSGQALSGQGFHVDIINIKLASQFFTHMSLALWFALLASFPYIIYEIWKFVCPALYDNERTSVRFTFVFGSVMFYTGCAVGYMLVFPLTLRFLYTYELSPAVVNQLSLESYMDNFLMLIFMMGIVFELPLVALFLSRIGILTKEFFHTYRRHAIVAILVAAAVITPSSDPFTLMAVFIPIYILWEFSALLITAKRRKPVSGELSRQQEQSM